MISADTAAGRSPHRRKHRFLGWQCRARQESMRKFGGKPGDAIVPTVRHAGSERDGRRIVTVLSRKPDCSSTPEMMHIAKRTRDPAQRREAAVRFFSAGYYQKPREFQDTLTGSFAPGASSATEIVDAERCTLTFSALGHCFVLSCRVRRLANDDPLRVATWWHNFLFNPNLHPGSEVLGFEPDWENSSEDNPFA